jgi:hypothetical protein
VCSGRSSVVGCSVTRRAYTGSRAVRWSRDSASGTGPAPRDDGLWRWDRSAPRETALHIDLGEGLLSFADGLINHGRLGFVSDGLLGDDPEGVKRGLRDAFRALLDRDFDSLLFAHGNPLLGGGKQALREFVDSS